uniref:F-box domain-containing protein n=1 Tax=Mycena chlorophos TaxID=658473 RepID=A0ABQ0LYM0_MYCCL|nr:predicted protein [Mycena chlorophos]
MTLSLLPVDVLLRIVDFLEIDDLLALCLVNQTFYELSTEHSFWLSALVRHRPLPLSVPVFVDLHTYSTSELKAIALHSRRLARNWALPFPRISGTLRSLPVGVHNSMLFGLPGTNVMVLYSLENGTAICLDTESGESSEPKFVGRILDMSSPIEEGDDMSVAVLINNECVKGLRAACSPRLGLEITFECMLDPAYGHTSVFMNSFCVGVGRADLRSESAGLELQTFSLTDTSISTVVQTDCPTYRTLGSAVVKDAVFIIALQHGQAAVYACPRRLMAGYPSSDTDDVRDMTLQRSHVGHIPPSSNDPEDPLTRFADYCVLSTGPYHGQSTISVVRGYAPDPIQPPPGEEEPALQPQLRMVSLEITFWPRPTNSEDGGESHNEAEREKAFHRKMQPVTTITVPGRLSTHAGTTWELLVIANSGLALLLLVDQVVVPNPDADAVESEPQQPESSEPEPKLVLVRFDPMTHVASQHVLKIPEGLAGEAYRLSTKNICALSLDDHRGVVMLVTTEDVLHVIPYAETQ